MHSVETVVLIILLEEQVCNVHSRQRNAMCNVHCRQCNAMCRYSVAVGLGPLGTYISGLRK